MKTTPPAKITYSTKTIPVKDFAKTKTTPLISLMREDCAAQYPDKRPSMSEVTRRIEELCRSSLPNDPQPNVVKEID
ncbi:unnamed protein product [Ilex paraguariensis]|uniref:Uncharacterized protein n=1 Tax=Ilex paraguariensis TaxID=185542 RepID=A0ABC8RKF3_9AQUA